MTSSPIRSQWRDPGPPPVQGTATVTLTRTVATESRADASKMSGWTANNHNVRCRPGNVCSGDGKWRATPVQLRLVAAPGERFENPRMRCESSAGKGVCAHVKVDRLAIEEGGRVAVLRLRASSRPARFILTADRVTTKMTTSEETQPVRTIRAGEMVTFATPVGATGVIRVVLAGREYAVALGSDAFDRSLVLVSRIATSTTVHHVYAVKAGA
jgi:hypothetical protein